MRLVLGWGQIMLDRMAQHAQLAISRPIASKRRTPRACGLVERLRLIACDVYGHGGLRDGSLVG
jgi:hypothetical protein